MLRREPFADARLDAVHRQHTVLSAASDQALTGFERHHGVPADAVVFILRRIQHAFLAFVYLLDLFALAGRDIPEAHVPMKA